jgi:hypothetical protein
MGEQSQVPHDPANAFNPARLRLRAALRPLRRGLSAPCRVALEELSGRRASRLPASRILPSPPARVEQRAESGRYSRLYMLWGHVA